MRPHLALILALVPAALSTQALAQSRYGLESPIPSPAPAATYATPLSWPGKVAVEPAVDTRPEPWSSWAQRQAQYSQPAPGAATLASLPPSPSTPRPIAGSPTAPPATPPASAPAPAPLLRQAPPASTPPVQPVAAAVAPAQPVAQVAADAPRGLPRLQGPATGGLSGLCRQHDADRAHTPACRATGRDADDPR